MSSSETASTPLVDESMCAFSDSCGGMSGPMSLRTTPRPPPRRLASGETTRLWKADGWARCPPVPWDERWPAVRAAWVSVAGLSPGLLPFIRRRARCDAGNGRARSPPPRNINHLSSTDLLPTEKRACHSETDASDEQPREAGPRARGEQMHPHARRRRASPRGIHVRVHIIAGRPPRSHRRRPPSSS